MIAEPLRPLARPIGEFRLLDGNPRRGDVASVKRSLRRFGQRKPIVVREDGTVEAGNTTLKAALELGWSEIAVVAFGDDDATAKAFALADNRTSELGSFDLAALAAMAADVHAVDPGLLEAASFTEADLNKLLADAGDAGQSGGERPSLADRFLIPPFDVLDARQGWWQERKKAWIGLGIQSELGRSGNTLNSDSAGYASGSGSAGALRMDYRRGEEKGLLVGSASGRDPAYYERKTAAEQALGRTLTAEEFEADYYQPSTRYESGTSIFDPVLCEIAYRWFSPAGATVIDPFAGGSVRALVAAMLGRRYAGNDLSAEQVKANGEQADDFAGRGLIDREAITWTAGDSADWVTELEPESADLLFTCPPYLWLERYSDDPADLSRMTEAGFEETYARILAGAAKALRPNRFAVIVTGDVREDRTGRLVDFRAMTVRAAASAGLAFQSGAVLVTQVGSLAVRASRAFQGTRTLGRTHQDVLVFCKGSRQAAAKACGDVDVHIPDALAGEWDDDDT